MLACMHTCGLCGVKLPGSSLHIGFESDSNKLNKTCGLSRSQLQRKRVVNGALHIARKSGSGTMPGDDGWFRNQNLGLGFSVQQTLGKFCLKNSLSGYRSVACMNNGGRSDVVTDKGKGSENASDISDSRKDYVVGIRADPDEVVDDHPGTLSEDADSVKDSKDSQEEDEGAVADDFNLDELKFDVVKVERPGKTLSSGSEATAPRRSRRRGPKLLATKRDARELALCTLYAAVLVDADPVELLNLRIAGPTGEVEEALMSFYAPPKDSLLTSGYEIARLPLHQSYANFAIKYARSLLVAATQTWAETTSVISKLIPTVWKNAVEEHALPITLLRLALVELTSLPVPYRVVISEAVQMAKEHCNERAKEGTPVPSRIINGCLGRYVRTMQISDPQQPDGEVAGAAGVAGAVGASFSEDALKPEGLGFNDDYI